MIDRASPTDLAMLAIDSGPVPYHVGAVLLLDAGPGFDLSAAAALIADRVRAVPRLRQRLVSVPPGCGRPIWVDDAEFDIVRHVRRLNCPAPGDERALLDVVAEMITKPLPRSRPLWSAVFVTGLADGVLALLLVFHHVLADGIGGVAAVTNLVDGVAHPRPITFPRPPPPPDQLAADAIRERLHALRRLPDAWRAMRRSMTAGGGLHPARAAACSLVLPTGPRRRLAVVHADVAELRATAHRHGGTVNDAVLTAVTGALHVLLKQRGESVDTFAVAVPVAGRQSATATELGNRVAPLLAVLPGTGDPRQRLQQIGAAIRAHKAEATGPPPIALLGTVFRAAARLGVYRTYMNRQHRLHTLVSNVRGPSQPLTFAGIAVKAVIPIAVGESGNLTVSFIVASYAGTLTITAVADPDHFSDLPTLTTALQAELATLTCSAGDSCG